MASRSHAQTAQLEAKVRMQARQIADLARSNQELVARCNVLTRNVATIAAAFKAMIEVDADDIAEDEAELARLEQRLVALVGQNAAAARGADGADGADVGVGVGAPPARIDPTVAAAPPPYQFDDGAGVGAPASE
jgi:hypothetical protein